MLNGAVNDSLRFPEDGDASKFGDFGEVDEIGDLGGGSNSGSEDEGSDGNGAFFRSCRRSCWELEASGVADVGEEVGEGITADNDDALRCFEKWDFRSPND